MRLSRREVLGAGVAAALLPSGRAAPAGLRVCVALEGGLDALAVLAPLDDARYRALRFDTRLEPREGLPLERRRFLHPALEPLLPLLRSERLGLVEGVGIEGLGHAHLFARDEVETRRPSRPSGHEAAVVGDGAEPAATQPRRLAGTSAQVRGLFAGAQAGWVLGARVPRAFAGVDEVAHLADAPPFARGFPSTLLGRRLALAAEWAAAGRSGAVYIQARGFDTHSAQGGARGQLAEQLADLAAGLRAFHDRLGDGLARVRLFTLAEFGRSPAENGASGTGDGGATAMFVLGGGVRGGLWGAEPPLEVPSALPVMVDARPLLARLASGSLA